MVFADRVHEAQKNAIMTLKAEQERGGPRGRGGGGGGRSRKRGRDDMDREEA